MKNSDNINIITPPRGIFEPAEMEFISFSAADVITTSGGDDPFAVKDGDIDWFDIGGE